MTTKDVTIRLCGLRASDVEEAAAKLRTWLLDGGGYETIEGVLVDPPSPRFQLGDGQATPAGGVAWTVLPYGDGAPAGYRLGVKSLRYAGKMYVQGQSVTAAVWGAMPASVQAFWLPYWT